MKTQTRTATYDAIIDEHEDRAFLDCGCQLWHLSSHSPLIVALKHCPLHSAARELLDAAKALQEWAATMGGWDAKPWKDLSAAVKKAGRQEVR